MTRELARRIAALEARHAQHDANFVAILLNPGETQEQAIAREHPTGLPPNAHVIFVRFVDPPPRDD
jgi:hypothetical protein